MTDHYRVRKLGTRDKPRKTWTSIYVYIDDNTPKQQLHARSTRFSPSITRLCGTRECGLS